MVSMCTVSSCSLCLNPFTKPLYLWELLSRVVRSDWRTILSTYLHIKPNLPLTLVNGGCYGYTPCLEELHKLLTISRYLEWQENPASKEEAGRGGASHSVRYLVFHPGLCDISHICMARWCLWRVGIDCWDSLLRSDPQGCRPSDCNAWWPTLPPHSLHFYHSVYLF